MQLTRPSVNYAQDWLDHSSILVLCGREKGFSLDVIPRGGSQQPFYCVLGHFRHGDTQPTEQLGDPSASLLLTSE